MERRTKPKKALLAVTVLLWIAPTVQAAGIANTEEEYPVSRFGRSEMRGQWEDNQERDPASAAQDEITHRASNAVTSPPLGTLRRNGVQEVALIAGDLGFFPRTVFVTRDIPVRMFVTGASKNSLCILMDSFQVRKQLKSQKIEEVSFTPTQPGKFRFYCPINGAEGFVVVREFERADGS
jgi:hypothetical protein